MNHRTVYHSLLWLSAACIALLGFLLIQSQQNLKQLQAERGPSEQQLRQLQSQLEQERERTAALSVQIDRGREWDKSFKVVREPDGTYQQVAVRHPGY